MCPVLVLYKEKALQAIYSVLGEEDACESMSCPRPQACELRHPFSQPASLLEVPSWAWEQLPSGSRVVHGAAGAHREVECSLGGVRAQEEL